MSLTTLYQMHQCHVQWIILFVRTHSPFGTGKISPTKSHSSKQRTNLVSTNTKHLQQIRHDNYDSMRTQFTQTMNINISVHHYVINCRKCSDEKLLGQIWIASPNSLPMQENNDFFYACSPPNIQCIFLPLHISSVR